MNKLNQFLTDELEILLNSLEKHHDQLLYQYLTGTENSDNFIKKKELLHKLCSEIYFELAGREEDKSTPWQNKSKNN
jgi:hypothetical protein